MHSDWAFIRTGSSSGNFAHLITGRTVHILVSFPEATCQEAHSHLVSLTLVSMLSESAQGVG